MQSLSWCLANYILQTIQQNNKALRKKKCALLYNFIFDDDVCEEICSQENQLSPCVVLAVLLLLTTSVGRHQWIPWISWIFPKLLTCHPRTKSIFTRWGCMQSTAVQAYLLTCMTRLTTSFIFSSHTLSNSFRLLLCLMSLISSSAP